MGALAKPQQSLFSGRRRDDATQFGANLAADGAQRTLRMIRKLARAPQQGNTTLKSAHLRFSQLTPAFEKIVIICPVVETGGPEALHQLCVAINKLGGDALLAYYDSSSKLEISDTLIESNPILPASFVARYSDYHAPHAQVIHLTANTLLIFPETLAIFAFSIKGPKRAIWWLSVDNGRNHEPLFSYKQFCDAYFNDGSLVHFYQSDYARGFLMAHGAKNIFPLYDYINRSFIRNEPNPARRSSVSFFPTKGFSLANSFFESAKDLSFIPIQNMTAEEVAAALSHTSVYIDFGHHPGKDRVPREAAASGNIVFIHSKGAGCHFLDYPIDQFFVFTLLDIQTGELAQKVRACLANPTHFFAQQWFYRRKIQLELDEFSLQVKTLFFSNTSDPQ